MSGDINGPQPRSQPRTQQWHSEQCPVQHKYLINIYQSFSVLFFIMAITFFVKLHNPVCSLLNGVNHTLAVHKTHPASLFKRGRKKKTQKTKTYVHGMPAIIPEFHVGGSDLKQRADILETNDSTVKQDVEPCLVLDNFLYTTFMLYRHQIWITELGRLP